MKKILIITYYWPPSGGAGVQRWLKFSKYLPEFDCEPIIITVDDKLASYAQTDLSLLKEISPETRVYKTKTFEPYNLYRKFTNKKEIPYGGFTNTNKVTIAEKIARFIRGNFFIPDPRKGWNRYAYKKALELITSEKIDVVITSGPPHSTHLIGKKLKTKTGIHWIADFRDPWTDIYYYKSLYHSWLTIWLEKKMEKSVLKYSDKILTVSNELKKLIQKKITGSDDKIIVLPNGYDHQDFKTFKRKNTTEFSILYTGTITENYRIESFVEAISRLTSTEQLNLKVRFVGNVPNEIITLFQNKGLMSLVEMMGYLPHDQAIDQLQNASLLLLAIPDAPDNKGIVTGKFFEYLATKIPVLAIGPVGGDVDLILKQCNAGSLFSYKDTSAMLDYLKQSILLFNQGEMTESSVNIEQFTRKHLTEILAKQL